MMKPLGLDVSTHEGRGGRTGRWSMGLTALGVGTAIALAVGCGSTSDDPYPDVQRFCVGKANAECNVAAADCSDLESDCLAAREGVCNADADAALAEGRKYDEAFVSDCLQAITTDYADGDLSAAEITDFTDKCERVYQGTASTDQACSNDYDCAGATNICDPIRKACGPSMPVGEGAGCNNPGETCPAGQYCGTAANSVAGLFTCVPRAPVGSGCSDKIACIEGSWCSSGTCVATLPTGSICTADDQCATGLICDPYALTSDGQTKCDSGIRFASGATSCAAYSSTQTQGTGTVSMTTDAGMTPVADAAPATTADAATMDSGAVDAGH